MVIYYSCLVGIYGFRKGLRSIIECLLCFVGKFCALVGFVAFIGVFGVEKVLGGGWGFFWRVFSVFVFLLIGLGGGKMEDVIFLGCLGGFGMKWLEMV